MIISKTPFRISLFGGGTDYPIWYNEHPGAVIGASIDKYCYISVKELLPFWEYKHRIVWSKIELVNEFDEINHPKVREALKLLALKHGVEIHHFADLPAKTGVGSSSAFTVGILNALYNLKGLAVPKSHIYTEAIELEQNICKEAVGSQDQILCAMGGFNKIEFPSMKITPLQGKHLEPYCMLFFTGLVRNASQIACEQIKLTPYKTQELEHMYQIVNEVEKNLSPKEVGRLLHESWEIKKKLSPHITSTYIDVLYGMARKAGAWGGKICGAGGGGFLLLFVEPDKQKNVRCALKDLLEVPFKFENRGTHIV